MPKQRHQPIAAKPPPSAKVPWLVILFLVACLVLVYLGFLRRPDKLLGPPLPPNEYIQQMGSPAPRSHGSQPGRAVSGQQ